ncbi:hypothetical protein EDD16DRAFT_1475717, partial [Pisolithus croceorrhizus]
QYLLSCVKCSPDIYLGELQYLLEQTRGVYVSMCTIECMLWRHRFTHKHVCPHTHSIRTIHSAYRCHGLHLNTMSTCMMSISLLLLKNFPHHNWFLLMNLLVIGSH